MLLNADLGEGEPEDRTAELMRVIDLANIACGGHAGNAETMERAVCLALEHGVKIGAHPGLAENFGRAPTDVNEPELRVLLASQTAALAAIVEAMGAEIHHVKLHGALYHAVERSGSLARAYVEAARAISPALTILALAGGEVRRAARATGTPALAEVFAERGYRADGTLIPRGEPGDLIHDPAEVIRRLSTLRGDTICIHADSPNAVKIAQAVRREFPRD